MAGNGWKGWKWLEMAGNYWKVYIVGNGWKCLEIGGNCNKKNTGNL